MPNHLDTRPYFLRPSIKFAGRGRILTSCPSASAFAIALGSPNPPLIAIAEETLDLRGADFSSALRLLMPTFSLPSAPPRLAAGASVHLKCSPTSPMQSIGALTHADFTPNYAEFNVYILNLSAIFCVRSAFSARQCFALTTVSSVVCLAPVNFRRNPPCQCPALTAEVR
jgi:hypothetical protein